jgi:photosystem II stability/assembly factor-like uncharacterized protein
MKKLTLNIICLSFIFTNIITVFSQDWIKQSPVPTNNTPYDIYCADSNTIVISCDEGIYKTPDRGLSWSLSTKESPNPIIEFCFVTDQLGWGVGADLTILKTADGGDSWITQKESGSDTVDLNSVFFVDNNKGWTAGEEGTILYTDDGGETWNKQASNTSADLEGVHFADELNGYCVGTDIALKTGDGGAVWESITNITDINEPEDVYCFNSDTCIILEENEVHRTTDGGANWTTESFTSGWFKELDFINDTDGYMIGMAGYGTYHCDAWGYCSWSNYDKAIWKTEDGGITWDRTLFSNTSDYLLDISIVGSNTICASGTEGYIILTPDAGNTWYKVSKGTPKSLYSGQFINSWLGYAAGEGGTVMVTPDAGDTWIKQSSGTSNDLNSIQFINSNTGWVVGNFGRIRKTINNGASWNYQNSGVTDDLFSVCFTDSLKGYAVGQDGTVLKTINSGSSWAPLSSGVSDDLNDVHFVDSLKGWAAGSGGVIIKTENGGDTWDQQESNTSGNINSVYFKNSQEGWAAGSSGLILRTVNGGEKWISLYSGLDGNLNSIYFLNGDTGWIAGSNGIIIRTTDGGNSWASSESLGSNSVNSLYFTDIDTGWVFGYNGLILKTVNGGGTYNPLQMYTVPQLLLPENNSTGISLDPVLFWASVDVVDSYRLQVSTSSSFSSPVIDESGISDTSYSVNGLDDDRKHYWRVAAEYGGEINIWSVTYNFRTRVSPPSAPSLRSPGDGAEGVPRMLNLDWTYVSGTDTYHLQVAEDSEFSLLVFEDSTITGTDYDVGPLGEETKYYWRVRAKNEGGISPYSDTYNFTTSIYLINPPPAPELILPDNGVRLQPVTLELNWSYVSSADTYHLQVSENPGFSDPVINDSTLTNDEQTVGPLEESTTYYWRVRAKNEGGYSAYSATFSFTTESENWRIQLNECVFSIYFIDENTGWAAGYDIFKTTDGGDTWDEIYTPSETLRDIYFINSLTGWAVGQNGLIIKTTNGGDTWETLNSETTDDMEAVYFINSSIGWVTGECGIVKTTDGGDSWINQFPIELEYVSINSVYFTDENNGWAAGFNILRTTDGGENWTECMVDGSYGMWFMLNSLFFADENNGWAVGYDGVYKTSDGGLTWYSQTDLIDIEYNDVYFTDEMTGWIAGEQGIIIKTTDGGESWDYLYSETSDRIDDVHFVNQDIGWIAVGCTIMKSETGGGEVCALPVPILESPYDYEYVYPEDVTLSWYPIPSALSYRLQISNTGVFTDPVFDEEGLTLTSYSISDPDSGMVYYWRVNVSNGSDTSHWSGIWRFTVYEISLSKPVLELPAEGSTIIDPLPIDLSWNETADADHYNLQVADNPDFNNPLFDEVVFFGTTESISYGLASYTTYYWRVRALNYSGGMSPWSDVWNFTTSGSVYVNELNSDIQYKLYPNPVNDILYIEGFENKSVNISVFSLDGKLLIQKHEKGITHLNISDLQSGIYIIKIVNPELMIIESIVKQ